jgi:uncharacterized membrane protein HdeD (DUF308 family)
MDGVTRENGAGPLAGPLAQLARNAWQLVLAIALASIVLGIVVLAWPHATLHVVGVLFGIYLLISGLAQVAASFGTHAETSMRVLAFVSGALSILLGIFALRGPLESILLLALWIGIGWLFRGFATLISATSDPDMPAGGWQIFAGLLGVIAGVVVLVAPVASVTALAVLVGIWLLFMGVAETWTALRLRAEARRLPPGV